MELKSAGLKSAGLKSAGLKSAGLKSVLPAIALLVLAGPCLAAAVTYPGQPAVDDNGVLVTSGVTATVASVTDLDGNAVATPGATAHVAGPNTSVVYDAAARGEAWITLSLAAAGHTFSGYAQKPIFASSDPQTQAAAAAQSAIAATRVILGVPAIAPGASGGLLTLGTGAGQLNPVNGLLPGLTTALTGTATGGTTTTITLAAGPATVDLEKGNYVAITGNTGAGQARTITGWNGGTLVATVSRPWAVTPDATSTYAVIMNPHPALDANLAVTTGTNGDKTGYSGTATNFVAAPTATQIAAGILSNPANLLATDNAGRVGTNNFPATVALAPADETKIGQIGLDTPGTVALIGLLNSGKTAFLGSALVNAPTGSGGGGTVTVGGYAAGQDPGSLLLVTPGNKLATSSAGGVTVSGSVTVGGYAAGQDPFTLAMAGATITIPGSGTTTGTPVVLSGKQLAALNASMSAGGAASTAVAAGSTATVTYYLLGQPPTAATVVAVSTPAFDASKVTTGRTVLIAQPFPAIQ